MSFFPQKMHLIVSIFIQRHCLIKMVLDLFLMILFRFVSIGSVLPRMLKSQRSETSASHQSSLNSSRSSSQIKHFHSLVLAKKIFFNTNTDPFDELKSESRMSFCESSSLHGPTFRLGMFSTIVTLRLSS